MSNDVQVLKQLGKSSWIFFIGLSVCCAELKPNEPLPAGACPPFLTSKGSHRHCLEHQGRKREFLIFVPKSYTAGSPLPLVLNFHGRKGTADQQAEMTQFHELGDRESFFVVEPEGIGRSWNVGSCCFEAHQRGVNDIGFVRQLLAALMSRYSIDPNRIYATGMSNGARMAHQLGCEMSDLIAAVAPVSGPLTSASCAPSRPVPIFSYHGKADRCTPYLGGFGKGHDVENLPIEQVMAGWGRRNACKDPPKVISVPDGTLEKRFYGNCRSGADVVLYSSKGAGHIWPGAKPYLFWRVCGGKWSNDFDATEEIWKFFKAHPKR